MHRASQEEALVSKMDEVIRLLQDMFVLDGAKAGMKKEEIRKLLAIDKRRVTRISKLIKKADA